MGQVRLQGRHEQLHFSNGSKCTVVAPKLYRALWARKQAYVGQQLNSQFFIASCTTTSALFLHSPLFHILYELYLVTCCDKWQMAERAQSVPLNSLGGIEL